MFGEGPSTVATWPVAAVVTAAIYDSAWRSPVPQAPRRVDAHRVTAGPARGAYRVERGVGNVFGSACIIWPALTEIVLGEMNSLRTIRVAACGERVSRRNESSRGVFGRLSECCRGNRMRTCADEMMIRPLRRRRGVDRFGCIVSARRLTSVTGTGCSSMRGSAGICMGITGGR